MMEHTDRHFRYFMRQITRRTLLYTEMITTGAILHGNREKLLGFSEIEKPVAIQLGGDDPLQLAECARVAEDWGHDEVNLNVGCPSDRVQSGSFGACLMAKPELVAAAVENMRRATSLPVTVKHRIGIDDLDRFDDLKKFVEIVSRAGCDRFMVHARKAHLRGLSPKENRTVPPLRYEDVYRLKSELPELTIEINGGVKSLEEVSEHLNAVDGVMIGRTAYDNPYLFAGVDSRFYGDDCAGPSRREVVERMIPYLERCMAQGTPPKRIMRHMLGLFAHQPAARLWRRSISENAWKPDAGPDILFKAMENMPNDVLDSGIVTQSGNAMEPPGV
jgi:tRNA-dihydrouridine synthase A